jgi:hypothetical protein
LAFFSRQNHGHVIAIDGKSLQRNFGAASSKSGFQGETAAA